MQTQTLFNESRLNELKELEIDIGKKIVPDLVQMYVHSTDELFARTPDLWREQNLIDLERMFHSLKSSSGNLGLTAMQTECARIEYSLHEMIGTKMTTDAPFDLLNLKKLLNESLQVLRQSLD